MQPRVSSSSWVSDRAPLSLDGVGWHTVWTSLKHSETFGHIQVIMHEWSRLPLSLTEKLSVCTNGRFPYHQHMTEKVRVTSVSNTDDWLSQPWMDSVVYTLHTCSKPQITICCLRMGLLWLKVACSLEHFKTMFWILHRITRISDTELIPHVMSNRLSHLYVEFNIICFEIFLPAW